MQSLYDYSGALEQRSLQVLRLLHAPAPPSTAPTSAAEAAASATASAIAAAAKTELLKQYSVRTRVCAAQWLLLYNTLSHYTLSADADDESDEKSVAAAKHARRELALAQSDADLELAWRLLKFSSSALSTAASEMATAAAAAPPVLAPSTFSLAAAAVDASRLDVACRMRNAKRISHTLDVFLARHMPPTSASSSSSATAAPLPAGVTDAELGVAFVGACLLGRWSSVSRIGSRLSLTTLREYHLAAAEQPVCDYLVQACQSSIISFWL
jgi:hypothetical protein